MAQPTKAKALKRLRKALHAIPELENLQRRSPKLERWRRNTQVTITNIFGNGSSHITDFNNIRFSLMGWTSKTPDSEHQAAYVKGLKSAASLLESMIEEINEYWEDENETLTPFETHENKQINTNEIFVVHGRDEGAKNAVARFIEKLDLVPVILSETPGEGRTIIEKFEQHAQVGCAIVLLTPDDAGSLQGDENGLNPRARQNVIFELGFFVGRLGRERVRALTKGAVEIPSDYAGIEYIPLDDSGGWKMKLIQELKSAGFRIDVNLAFRA